MNMPYTQHYLYRNGRGSVCECLCMIAPILRAILNADSQWLNIKCLQLLAHRFQDERDETHITHLTHLLSERASRRYWKIFCILRLKTLDFLVFGSKAVSGEGEGEFYEFHSSYPDKTAQKMSRSEHNNDSTIAIRG